ncbi:MAG: chloride channel protein, partial [Leptolyngbya sp. SIO3F4]|nr:chloride channel protein [Leptolyngbya sp. SIO3F4]
MTIASKEISNLSTPKTVTVPQDLTYFRTLLYAAIVGAAGGIVATIYYFVLEQMLELVWDSGREFILGWFPAWLPHWHYTWIVATVGGLGVGLCLHYLGLPG